MVWKATEDNSKVCFCCWMKVRSPARIWSRWFVKEEALFDLILMTPSMFLEDKALKVLRAVQNLWIRNVEGEWCFDESKSGNASGTLVMFIKNQINTGSMSTHYATTTMKQFTWNYEINFTTSKAIFRMLIRLGFCKMDEHQPSMYNSLTAQCETFGK